MNINETRTLMTMISKVWGEHRYVNEETVLIFAELLADIPADIGRQAVIKLLASEPFPIVPAHIRRECFDLMDLGAPDIELALRKAYEHCRFKEQQQFANGNGYTPYEPPEAHPAIMRALATIGFANPEGFNWESEFRRAYVKAIDAYRKDVLCSNMTAALEAKQETWALGVGHE